MFMKLAMLWLEMAETAAGQETSGLSRKAGVVVNFPDRAKI
jgi:hypothetical protein